MEIREIWVLMDSRVLQEIPVKRENLELELKVFLRLALEFKNDSY